MTPTRKPISKATPIKSPKVPTTNGAVSKTKITAKDSVASADNAEQANKVQTNGTAAAPAKLNGHIGENGTGAEKIIDVSAD